MNYWPLTKRLLIVLLLWCPRLYSQAQDQFVALSENTPPLKSADAVDTLFLEFVIAPGYHIQSDNPANSSFIATRLDWEFVPSNFNMKEPLYPEAETFLVGEEKTDVFSDTLRIRIPVHRDEQPAGTYKMTGELFYQACTKLKCFFPRRLPFEVAVTN